MLRGARGICVLAEACRTPELLVHSNFSSKWHSAYTCGPAAPLTHTLCARALQTQAERREKAALIRDKEQLAKDKEQLRRDRDDARRQYEDQREEFARMQARAFSALYR